MTATRATTSPEPSRDRINLARMWTVARTDLKQLLQARDFWVPMALLGSFFFLIIPVILLLIINSVGNSPQLQDVAKAIDPLAGARKSIPPGLDPNTNVQFTIAVFLLAPVAVVVPLTISSAVGASTIVGERERGTGEFLAHSPADTREIFLGKLIASLVPGYLTTIVGFGAYSLLVNLMLARKVGYWFFPTPAWWLLIMWVLPPFLALALSLVLRLSARVRSTAAAQQATGLVTLPLILIAYGQSTGALVGENTASLSIILGGIAWVVAIISLATGVRSVRRASLLGVANEQ